MRMFLGFLVVLQSLSAYALKLSDYTPYEYDVRFTNPVCREYAYKETVLSRSGEKLVAKPKGAYCTRADFDKSAAQERAPLKKLLEWIRDPKTKEIFFTYLSFSDATVAEALCEAIEKRDVKVTFVLDEGTDTARGKEVLKCKAKSRDRQPRMELRGQDGGIGYAHNKIFIVNPYDKNSVRIVFGSGNMTSGIVLHHENWHFITTSPQSYFAGAHICVMEAELDHAETATVNGKEVRASVRFKEFMKDCLGKIQAEPESDIQVFFVPGGGREALESIQSALDWADSIKIAAHRFSFTEMIDSVEASMSGSKKSLRLVFDDDMLWAAEGAKRPNMPQEIRKVRQMEKVGGQVRYIETNHGQMLLQHNKFIVFEGRGRMGTFVGAGNFTGDAFSKNLENFYFVSIPEVVRAMSKQHDHLFDNLGTAEKNLPREDKLP
jgi:hypothetical protein